MTLAAPAVDGSLLEEIEGVAVDLARQAGARMIESLKTGLEVAYKTEGRGRSAPNDPVSQVDTAVEELLRAALAERFPGHAIVGEEIDLQPSPDDEFLWVVDPVDGTTNFVNGFPLFACSIGVLHRGVPIAGAIWCSASHELRPGVFHARLGGSLCFDTEPVQRPASAGLKRRLAAAPGGASGRTLNWDHRVTGSAALECAFVAAGIFNSAGFNNPFVWDVAAGVVLVRAAGLEVWQGAPPRGRRYVFAPFERFEAPPRVREARAATLRDWRRPLLIGEAEVVRVRAASMRRPSAWQRNWRRFRRYLGSRASGRGARR